MGTTSNSNHKATVSLKLPATVADLIAYATGVVHAMTSNAAARVFAAKQGTVSGSAKLTTKVLFRYRSVTKLGESDWSQGVSLPVK